MKLTSYTIDVFLAKNKRDDEQIITNNSTCCGTCGDKKNTEFTPRELELYREIGNLKHVINTLVEENKNLIVDKEYLTCEKDYLIHEMEKLTHDNECLTTLSEHLFQKFIDARFGLVNAHKELADIEQYYRLKW